MSEVIYIVTIGLMLIVGYILDYKYSMCKMRKEYYREIYNIQLKAYNKIIEKIKEECGV